MWYAAILVVTMMVSSPEGTVEATITQNNDGKVNSTNAVMKLGGEVILNETIELSGDLVLSFPTEESCIEGTRRYAHEAHKLNQLFNPVAPDINLVYKVPVIVCAQRP